MPRLALALLLCAALASPCVVAAPATPADALLPADSALCATQRAPEARMHAFLSQAATR
jgi:hypothetical protein